MSNEWTEHVEDGFMFAAGLLLVGCVVAMLAILGYEGALLLWQTTAVVPAGWAGLTVFGALLVGGFAVAVVVVCYCLGAFANEGIPRIEAWYDYLTGGDDNP